MNLKAILQDVVDVFYSGLWQTQRLLIQRRHSFHRVSCILWMSHSVPMFSCAGERITLFSDSLAAKAQYVITALSIRCTHTWDFNSESGSVRVGRILCWLYCGRIRTLLEAAAFAMVRWNEGGLTVAESEASLEWLIPQDSNESCYFCSASVRKSCLIFTFPLKLTKLDSFVFN